MKNGREQILNWQILIDDKKERIIIQYFNIVKNECLINSRININRWLKCICHEVLKLCFWKE